MNTTEALRILAAAEARELNRCGTCDGYGWVPDPACPLEFARCEAPCRDCATSEQPWPLCHHADAR